MNRILVIEDESQTRSLFIQCLEAEGSEAIGAENGCVGLQRIQEHLPNLVICDTLMPLDGYGILIQLRQDPATAILPFIFLTAKSSRAEYRHGLELGADDYLIKPCTAEDLLKSIEKFVKLNSNQLL